jgi:hypothetical protein
MVFALLANRRGLACWFRRPTSGRRLNAARMKKDADLDSLRARPDFQKLLADLQPKAK